MFLSKRFSRKRIQYFDSTARLRRILGSRMFDAPEAERLLQLEKFIRLRSAYNLRSAIRTLGTTRQSLRIMKGMLDRAQRWRRIPMRKRRGVSPWLYLRKRLWAKPLRIIKRALKTADKRAMRRAYFLESIRERLPYLFKQKFGAYRLFVQKLRRLQRKRIYRFARKKLVLRQLQSRSIRQVNQNHIINLPSSYRQVKQLMLTPRNVIASAKTHAKKWKRRENRRRSFRRNRSVSTQPVYTSLQIHSAGATGQRMLRQRFKTYRTIYRIRKFDFEIRGENKTMSLSRTDRRSYRRYYIWTLSIAYGQFRERNWQSLKLKTDLNFRGYASIARKAKFANVKSITTKNTLRNRFAS